METLYIIIIIILLVTMIILILNNNRDVNNYIDYTKENFNTMLSQQLNQQITETINIPIKNNNDKNKNKNNNNDNDKNILDSNCVSPYAVSYSSFYYDQNKDPYIGVYSNKKWLYDPWNTNLKYI